MHHSIPDDKISPTKLTPKSQDQNIHHKHRKLSQPCVYCDLRKKRSESAPTPEENYRNRQCSTTSLKLNLNSDNSSTCNKYSSSSPVFSNDDKFLSSSTTCYSTGTPNKSHSILSKSRSGSVASGPICPVELQRALDPQIQLELENLNQTSNKINKIENRLESVRSEYRNLLSNATNALGRCAKKLGNCVEKARPFYIAKYEVKICHKQAQNATIKYERAVRTHEDAKEMVNVAEQNMRLNKSDPAWHQVLNHATNRVNEAEIERYLIDEEVQKTTKAAILAQINMNRLNKDHKHAIHNSIEYFELKYMLNEKLDETQKHVSDIQNELKNAKIGYKKTLKTLENISERIHFARAAQKEFLNIKEIPRQSSEYNYNEVRNHSCTLIDDECCGEVCTEKNSTKISSNEKCSNCSLNQNLEPLQTIEKAEFHQKLTKLNGIKDLEKSQNVVEMALAAHKQQICRQLEQETNFQPFDRKNSSASHYSYSSQTSHEDIIHEDLKRRDSVERLDVLAQSNSVESLHFKSQNSIMMTSLSSHDLKAASFADSGIYRDNSCSATSGISSLNFERKDDRYSSTESEKCNRAGKAAKRNSNSRILRLSSVVFKSLSIKDLQSKMND